MEEENTTTYSHSMEINGEISIRIEGKDYWRVSQFARLTGRKEGSIRLLLRKGNRIRKLKTIRIGDRPFIEAEELFNFPFVVCGRPAGIGEFVEKYYLENGELIKNEEMVERGND